MKFQSLSLIPGLFSLFLLIIFSPHLCQAQQSELNQDPRITALNLGVFDDIQSGTSSCGDNCSPEYTKQVAWINAWSCIAKACGGSDKGPSSCVDNFNSNMSVAQKESFDKLICTLVKNQDFTSRQSLLQAFPDTKEAGYVEGTAYVDALQGNSMACQNVIKNYIGFYGPSWNARWFEDMSGCRILTKERTRQEEENDYSAWADGDCSKITNPEMRSACSSKVSFPDGTKVYTN